ncbi:hypothetical protein TNCT_533331 [Trichonephila clavata]|uniref:Uncharacterized protein n=1 Tax=Trichonephila clavata TaxID=2740835 RepID=A0A8X6JQI6_TRICU|nr:hypothetical protein TNCT_533331 [Trichonephila clavata]
MAANGSEVEEPHKELDRIPLNGIGVVVQNSATNPMFDHAFAFDPSRANAPWINHKNKVVSSTAPLTLCAQTDSELRRTLRIDRSGSTERKIGEKTFRTMRNYFGYFLLIPEHLKEYFFQSLIRKYFNYC